VRRRPRPWRIGPISLTGPVRLSPIRDPHVTRSAHRIPVASLQVEQRQTPADAFCPDDDTRDNAIARRNVLVALWAGSLMGLQGSALSAYAVEVHAADHLVTGDADVIAKLRADLAAAGVTVGDAEIRARLEGFHREALRQVRATD